MSNYVTLKDITDALAAQLRENGTDEESVQSAIDACEGIALSSLSPWPTP